MILNDIPTLRKNAELAIKQKEYKEAHGALLQILKINPQYADAFYLLAMIPLAIGNIDKAIELIMRAIKISPNKGEYQVQIVKCYTLKGEVLKIVEWTEKAGKHILNSAFDNDILGVAYSRIGLHENAASYFKKAIEIKSNEANFYYNLASSLKFLGDFKNARDAYENAIKLNPKHYKAHSALSSLGGVASLGNNINRLKVLLKNENEPENVLLLSHSLASEYESQERFDDAFEVLIKAKKQRVKQLNYSFTEDTEMFDSVTEVFTNPSVKFTEGYNSDKAIFVVGMPRTGTTIVERIISNYPEVNSVGELHNFEIILKDMAKLNNAKLIDSKSMHIASNVNFEELGQAYINSVHATSGNSGRFVDKLPLNILNAGFIIKALPACKIICLDRNPLDTIVSNFRQIFSPHYAYCYYSNSLEATTNFYLKFRELYLFWQRLFPNNFLVVNYESLVNSPELEAQKIIEFCGLNWQKNCLDIQNNSSPVATASASQVRQPINNKSVGNWKKYNKYLDNVKKQLNEI